MKVQINGKEVEITELITKKCNHCDGVGFTTFSEGCKMCYGIGMIFLKDKDIKIPCPRCGEKGFVVLKQCCYQCQQTGKILLS